ncbi:MAG: NAD(P)/FAD-dependent oxidoreductase [Actinocatenispora sp.]
MTRTRTALIIGGGIAGPATAMALRKAGLDAVVYEARPTGADGIGAFLTLASNGVDALRVLDADAPVLAAGFPTPGITLRSGTGRYLGRTRTGRTLPDGTTSQSITRAALYGALHDEARARGVRVEYGRRLVDAQDTGTGIRAVFADGSDALGDILIGCDGIHSTVRRIIDPAAPAPTYTGLTTTGGYARGVAVDTEPGSYEMIFGRRAFFGYAAASRDEVWWFANLPQRREPSTDALRAVGGDQRRRRLLELFADDAGPAVPLITATPETMPMSAIHCVGHLPTWWRGRMIVIGDAAHAPSPTSGQGASLSIEDAVVLATCLRDQPDSAAAFARYEQARRPRVERIVRWASRINNSKAAGPVGRALRDAMLPRLLRLTADSSTQRQLYDYHIDWDAAVA